jgi:hypothetical protein
VAKRKLTAFATRTAKALLVCQENGENKEETFDVIYRVMTPTRTRQLNQICLTAEQQLSFAESLAQFLGNNREATVEEILHMITLLLDEQEEEKSAIAQMLAKVVVSIPGIVEDDDEEIPVKVDAEMLDSTFDWMNLNAIREAIKEDQNPRHPSSNA